MSLRVVKRKRTTSININNIHIMEKRQKKKRLPQLIKRGTDEQITRRVWRISSPLCLIL